ncbi:MAG TPA: diguanylate cyclase, partial [Ktedonobacteraceae bacterium]|nr:diguanylate cyclase [Ktedonobacteraceae bacterium]
MPFSSHRQLKLVHLVRLGFGLLLLCMIVTFSANLVADTQYNATTDRLIDHLYPARNQAKEIGRLALAIDDTGALYILSRNPAQQAQLLQTYQQDAQALRVALSAATAMADTAEQRSALSDFTYYFFGDGGYYESQQAFAFAQKRAGQDLLASQNYVNNPFLSSFQADIQVYTDVVNSEIAQGDARLNSVSTLVRFLNIGLGGSACLFGIGIAVFIARSIGRLYRQIEEKNARLAENNTLLQALSKTDPLTELPNHRALLSTLKQELERAQRYDRPCSLLFLDLDHFKALNDSYGHTAGDIVLCAFAGILSATIRTMDTAGRWGGEEFVVILPEATAEDALGVAERIREAISFSSFEISGGLHLTCSVGVACYPEHAADQDALLTAADQAMYGAKRLGRNQVRMVSDPAIIALLTSESAEGGREETALHGTVEALITLVEKRDWSLGHHSQQVADLVRQLALAYGMSLEDAQVVAVAGQLHDIGKVAIPD